MRNAETRKAESRKQKQDSAGPGFNVLAFSVSAFQRFSVFPAALCLLGCGVFAAAAEEPRSSSKQKEPEPVAESDFVNPQTAKLGLYVGPWKVVETHFNERGEVAGAAQGSEEITWIAGHRAIQRKYLSTSESATYRAVGLLTWNDFKKKYQGTWYDSVSTTGAATVEADAWDDRNHSFTFTLDRLGPDGTPSRYKIVERFDDVESRTSTTYLLKGSSVVKLLEVKYTRSTPCPDSLRVLYDSK